MKQTTKSKVLFDRPVEKMLAGASGAYMLSQTFKGVYTLVNASGYMRYSLAGVLTLLVGYFAVMFIRKVR